MADVGIIEGEKLLIQIGDGGGPEVFSHPCLINTSRGIAFTTNVTETEVRDCVTPSAPAKIVRKAKSIDFTITGAGKVDKNSCRRTPRPCRTRPAPWAAGPAPVR
jgi:hypothetical protein